MHLVLIRHKVANYAKWKRAVRAFASWRKKSGEKCFKAFRAANSPNDVTVLCSWASAAKLRKFMRSAKLRTAMREAGVVSKPEIRFFSAADDLSAG